MDSSKITQKTSLLIIISSLASLGVHLYLIQQHILTKYTMGEASSLCNINSFLNCGSSIASSYSEFLGTPLSLFAIVTHLLILFFFLRSFLSDSGPEQKRNMSLALCLAIFTFAASLVMGIISLVALKSLCPFCTVAYVLSLLSLLGIWKLSSKSKSPDFTTLVKPLLFSGVLILALGWASGKVFLRKYKHPDFDQITLLQIQQWASQVEKSMALVAPQKFGPDSAKMKIVEFADFLCPHCKFAYSKLHTFAKANGDVQILFQTWPLDGCAPVGDTVGRRCELAKISYCADQQGLGDAAQGYIFAMQEIFAELSDLKPEIEVMNQKLSLNSENMASCLANPQTLADIKAQIELGKTLGIEGTPTIYINNKLFPGGAHIPALQEVYKKIQSGH
jgi:protein-disulfide isomerase/uncharacterized membrane protein